MSRWPSVLAAFINVVSFDLFFIAPRGTTAVPMSSICLRLAMLTVGLIIGNLTAGSAFRLHCPLPGKRARQLCEMSKALSAGCNDTDVARKPARIHSESTFNAQSQVLLPRSVRDG